MKTVGRQRGFSLIEVNMAVFVMAVGILSMIVLYPLGLRESTQGQEDLQQSMTADYLFNQAVSVASMTNFPWTQWSSLPRADTATVTLNNTLPQFMKERMVFPQNASYIIECCLVPGRSDRIMGILVQSTEQTGASQDVIARNPIYYAEVLFQGDPVK